MKFISTHNGAKTFDGLMHQLLNDFPKTFGKSFDDNSFQFPPVNITEKGNAYHLEVAAPGMQKSDFSIKLDGNLLTISAEKKQLVKDENEKSIRKEFNHKAFKRSFTLDEKIDAGNIVAKYEQGILLVELPKKPEVKENSKEITIL